VIWKLCLCITVDIAIRLRVGHSVVHVPTGERDLSSTKRPERRWVSLIPRLLCIAIRLRVGHSVVQVPAGERDLSSPKRPERRWGPLIPRLVCIMGFPGIQRWRREVGHQSLSSAEVKNVRSYASTSPHAVMACAGTQFVTFKINGLLQVYW
jgi:hypothetical protein